MSWARLLKRVFDIDIEHCPNCGRSLKIIAAIEDPPVIDKILSHLGLPTRAPPRSPVNSSKVFPALSIVSFSIIASIARNRPLAIARLPAPGAPALNVPLLPDRLSHR
jgi:hypothetical protein